jgi:hypothetical protein
MAVASGLLWVAVTSDVAWQSETGDAGEVFQHGVRGGRGAAFSALRRERRLGTAGTLLSCETTTGLRRQTPITGTLGLDRPQAAARRR